MLSGPPSAAPEREGATNNRIAIAAATAKKGLGETEPAEDAGELLISVASAGLVLTSEIKGEGSPPFYNHWAPRILVGVP